MKKKTIVISLIATAIIIFSFFICNIVFAENLSELNDRREELEEKIEDANTDISEIKIELTDTLKQINELNFEIYNYEEELKTVKNSLKEIEKSIKNVEEKIKIIEDDYKKQKEALENRIVALYEAGEVQYLDFLLSSNSLSDFISNYYIISELMEYDNEILSNIEREKTEIEDLNSILSDKKAELKQQRDEIETTETALENAKIIKNSYLSSLTEEEKEINSQIEKLELELDAVENQIYSEVTGLVSEDYVGGILSWPTPGYTTVTSKFGMRLHPIFKYYRMHSGVDIGIPTGGYIIAVNDGVVIKSEYNYSYGNMIIIDHGGGLTTVYGHGSKLMAKVGDEVKRGQVVMLAGSTGWSTGPHLHFEVRINGTCIDPLPYITKQEEINEEENETTEDNNENQNTQNNEYGES